MDRVVGLAMGSRRAVDVGRCLDSRPSTANLSPPNTRVIPGQRPPVADGWGDQRTITTIGILLMGARLYNPAIGLFTGIDPV